MQRRALNAVALALGVASVPTLSLAQRGNQPGPDTPKLLVVVFQSPVRALGVEVADAVRQRFLAQMNPRQLAIVTRESMVNYLSSSGYNADSSLGPTDLKELARGMRADNLVGGEVVKNGSTMRITPRLMLSTDPSIAQPLPVIETSSLNDAARQTERAYHEAAKQLADDRACKNHLRSALDPNGNVIKPDAVDKAVVSANAGVAKYSQATIVRLCLANAYQIKKQWDSVLAVVDVIKRIDPTNKQANIFAVEAMKQKADAETDPAKQATYREASVRLLVALLNSDPFNQSLQNSVISELAKLGKPAVAIPIVEDLLKLSPGDPPLLRTRWNLIGLDAAGSDADSVGKMAKLERFLTSGEEMVKADTALADSTYYFRQVAAAMLVSPRKGVEWTSKAVARYPTNQEYWWYKARMERDAGQTDASSRSLSRLLQLNSRYPNATLMLGQLYLDQKMNDSAIAVARRAVASGEPRQTWGQFLLRPTQDAYQKAAASDAAARADTLSKEKRAQATADYEATLALGQESNTLSPSATGYFFVGVSSFQVGLASVNAAQAAGAASVPSTKGAPTRAQRQAQAASRAEACRLAKKASDMLLLTMTNMPRGGSVDAGTAQTILGYTPQLSTAAESMAKAYCGPPPATKAGTRPPPSGPGAP